MTPKEILLKFAERCAKDAKEMRVDANLIDGHGCYIEMVAQRCTSEFHEDVIKAIRQDCPELYAGVFGKN